MQELKEVLKLRFENKSQRQIALLLKVSRNTVSRVFKAADETHCDWEKVKFLDSQEIYELLFPNNSMVRQQVTPDFAAIHKELLKPHTTIHGLWEEYVAQCKDARSPFYKRSYFFEMYRDYVNKNRLTMHINHKPGDKIMVDWAGSTLTITDQLTGDPQTVYLFVGTLPFSMYTYVQACSSMKQADWIDAHVRMFAYFNGVSRLLVPDNLKTGVKSHRKYEDPVINKVYQEMADHYGTTILPARPHRPKDKAAVEGSVHSMANHVISRLRNRKFFKLESLNMALADEMSNLNQNPFQKREGSRESVFIEEEQDFLMPLPIEPFEISEWKSAKVQLNYHVQIHQMYYSLPYEYVGKQVDVRLTAKIVEIYYKGTRISSHNRCFGRSNQYSTSLAHMPENHQMFQWNAERFEKWARSIGPATHSVIVKLIHRNKVEEQAYKSCVALLKLSDKYTTTRLEDACQLALEHISQPSYKNIRLILDSGQDQKRNIETHKKEPVNSEHAFLRGKEYYGGKSS
jgi:transposase